MSPRTIADLREQARRLEQAATAIYQDALAVQDAHRPVAYQGLVAIVDDLDAKAARLRQIASALESRTAVPA
jgi:hypothetical protein